MKDKGEIVFTITKITNNFGGLFAIKTKSQKYNGDNFTDVGVMELFDVLQEISEDLNDEGYSVLFEVE